MHMEMYSQTMIYDGLDENLTVDFYSEYEEDDQVINSYIIVQNLESYEKRRWIIGSLSVAVTDERFETRTHSGLMEAYGHLILNYVRKFRKANPTFKELNEFMKDNVPELL